MTRLARLFSVAAATFAATAWAAPQPRLGVDPAAGEQPLVVAFDASQSTADSATEQLVFTGNGEALPFSAAMAMPSYNFSLAGAYQAQAWLRDGAGAVAASAPIAIRVSRARDGLLPPMMAATAAHTTDAATMAFMATLAASAGDDIVARRWEFGDGETSGEEQPFHTYAQSGVYQAMLVATTRAGMPAYGRVIVVVGEAAPPAPSLLVSVSPEDASLLTPVTVLASLEGVAPDTKVESAVVGWPDLDDASPLVTPGAGGIVVASQHALPEPGWFDVPVTVKLAGRDAPLSAVAHILVSNADGSMPSPVLLMPPSPTAAVGQPYAPNAGGPSPASLLVAGNGPFAFGAASPSPVDFRVDDTGQIAWTPTQAEVGRQRVAVRIVDADGNEAVRDWVVDVAGKHGGCSLAASSPAPSGAWLLLVALALVARRLRA